MNRTISLVLALLILVSGFAFSAFALDGRLILGDADLDGIVTVKDASEIQKSVAQITALSADATVTADCDMDKIVTVKDASLIQKYSASIPTDFPIGDVIVSKEEYNPTKPDTDVTIYFSNNVGWSTVNVYLYKDSDKSTLADWPGVPMTLHGTNDYGEKIYKYTVDVTKYDRVIFNNGKSQTMNAAVTVASSGYFITTQTPKTGMGVGLYAFDETDYGNKTTIKLNYPDGYEKPIEIWTPKGYDAKDTSKKYSVLYLLDGQNQFDDADPYNGGWGSDEIVTSLMKNGGDGIILVGIDNTRNRDNELTPDIGDIVPSYANQGFDNGSGDTFSKFVAETVVPYVESNYNVYTDAAHTGIAGSSSGGIEAFYIGMENMDEFGRIGALSPAFLLYSKQTWDNYLAKFDFKHTENLPRIYFYNGGGDALELEIMPNAAGMIEWLTALGYPADWMIFKVEDKHAHNEAAWRSVMPEVITWLFELQ